MIAQISMKMSRTRPPARDRILDLRGHGQQLGRRPERGAPERVDLRLLGVALEQERRDRAKQVDTNGGHDDRHQVVA